jgi:hypothetical protein
MPFYIKRDPAPGELKPRVRWYTEGHGWGRAANAKRFDTIEAANIANGNHQDTIVELDAHPIDPPDPAAASKPYGWRVIVFFLDGTSAKFDKQGSSTAVRRWAMMKRLAKSVEFIEPYTKEQY